MTQPQRAGDTEGLIFDIDTFAVHDGPGIRMAVYLKGCPLTCQWCHSPESLRPERELIFVPNRCALCGACAAVCPEGVHRLDGSEHTLHRAACVVCGGCIEQCPSGAVAIMGRRVSAVSVVDKAARLKPFFRHSGGGITLTGGEVTSQVDFAEAVLVGCQSKGIHTAVETSGACTWDALERLLPHTDLVLYDIKLMDDETHRRWTGASNRQILDNAARLAETSAAASGDVQVRVPLIPDITDTEENLSDIFAFMRSVGLPSVALLPYNPASGAKYEWLDLPYTIQGETQTEGRLARLLSMAREAGVEAVIG